MFVSLYLSDKNYIANIILKIIFLINYIYRIKKEEIKTSKPSRPGKGPSTKSIYNKCRKSYIQQYGSDKGLIKPRTFQRAVSTGTSLIHLATGGKFLIILYLLYYIK